MSGAEEGGAPAPMAVETDGLLVKLRSRGGKAFAADSALGDFEHILDVPAGVPNGFGLAEPTPSVWVRMEAGDNAWDRAHAMISGGFAADGQEILAAEPDIASFWPGDEKPEDQRCTVQKQTKKGGQAVGPSYAWHLEDAFSGLRSARDAVGAAAQARVRVAHLDTGYDPDHETCPANIAATLERNYTGRGDKFSAVDLTPDGRLTNRGHGVGTIGLLAGAAPKNPPDGFSGPIGGAPDVEIVPVRVANSVVRLTSGSVAKGFNHAADRGAHVLSMSMGGLASAVLADAVNRCYDQGMVMVTAAGNFIGPGPRSIVYPARMRRVLAATGVMANGDAYFGLTGTFQGCHGPDSKMPTAIAGWTPNVLWPEIGCPATIDHTGSGTSSATAQIAAAAALWIAKYFDELQDYPEPWMKGEAVRQALLASARARTAKLTPARVKKMLGAGALDAFAALDIAPMGAADLRKVKQPEADAAWSWLKLLTGRGVGLAPKAMSQRERMLNLEVLQLVGRDPELESRISDPDEGTVSAADRKAFLQELEAHPLSSRALKAAAAGVIGARTTFQKPENLPKPKEKRDAPDARPRPPAPAHRRLRIYALDPSLGADLESFQNAVATVDVRFESDKDGNSILQPGPVGEYVEVVDVDPASDRFYPPVNLDDDRMLLLDGLDPSEGNPQFHQQMVYAVAMRTIANFEKALGRRAIWAVHERKNPKPGQPRFEYVPRLRIYPHALRERNAYYSPSRMALMFGYFPAESAPGDTTPPGTLVFGCLSADIVAHEMTHALLDGYTPGYRDSSNPDVGAFHEGFADIVALFQHFQYADLVRSEIARARGALGAASLLGGMARQFGEGSGKRGPLRDYVNQDGDIHYDKTLQRHARGSLLVAAMYRAFVSIFDKRTGDLIRLATGGSGVLQPGALHPDLVERLAEEACHVAGQILRMSIRALDYCPPVDISFDAYLRGLITADTEHAPHDELGYRVALLESFRHFGMLPKDLRTVSVETLCWRKPYLQGEPSPQWLIDAVRAMQIDWQKTLPRWEAYQLARHRGWILQKFIHQALEAKETPEAKAAFCRNIGLQYELPRYNQDMTEKEARPGDTTFHVRAVRTARRTRADGKITNEIVVVLEQRRPEGLRANDKPSFWFRGGATLVIDSSNARNVPEIRYLISKRVGNKDRLERERRYRRNPASGLRAMYFDDRGLDSDEPFAALHSEDY